MLAVSSGGGHWIELLRLRRAFEGCTVHFVTVQAGYQRDIGQAPFHTVRDATAWNPAGLALLALQIAVLVLRVRPAIVVSTGAAPGLFAVVMGRLMGSRTIWVDSLANVEELSKAGRLAGRFADLWLTQWANLARPEGPEYAGQIL